MTQLLTLYPANVAASKTVATANLLFSTIAAAPSSLSQHVLIGTATGFGEIWAQNNTAAWAAGALNTQIAPTGHGWFLDSAQLDASTLQAGLWTAQTRINTSANTMTVDLYYRVFLYNPDIAVYTSIGVLSALGQNVTTTATNFPLPAQSFASIFVPAGNKLYLDLWGNITASTMVAGNTLFNSQSSQPDGGSPNIFITSAGYGYIPGITPRYVIRGFLSTIIPDTVTQPLPYSDRGMLATIVYESRTFVPRALGGVYIPDTVLWGPRALGGTLSLPLATATTYTFMEALTANDSASSMVSGSFSVDALSASDALLATGTDLPLDGLSVSEIGGLSGWSIDALSASDGLLGMGMSLYTEANAASSDLRGSGITGTSMESLSSSDNLLEGEAFLSLETNGTSDALLATGVDASLDSLQVLDGLLIGHGSLSTESNTVSTSVLGQEGGFLIESLSTGEILLEMDTALPLDTLSITDLGKSLAGWPVDALTITESTLVTNGALPLDTLTGTSTNLDTANSALVEALTANDSASSMVSGSSGGGPVTATYSFTDSLVVMDAFGVLEDALPTLGLIVGEVLFQVQGSMPIEGNSASDSFLGQNSEFLVESLFPDALLTRTDTYLPAEVQSVIESLSLSGSYTFLDTGIGAAGTLDMISSYGPIDTLPARDLENALAWGVDTLVVSDGLSIAGVWNPVSASPEESHVLTSDVPLWVETLLLSDLLTMESVLPPPTATLSLFPVGAPPTGNYEGKTVVPASPSGVYMVNGIPLDSQPIVCTAPLEPGNGLRFLVGSTFFLLFDRPTTLTQSLLPDGSVVSMTFALANRNMVTVPQVQVASTLVIEESSATFAVTCTLLSSLATPTLSLASSS